MLGPIVNLLSEYDVGWTYIKISTLLYTFCYVIEEVLGKYLFKIKAITGWLVKVYKLPNYLSTIEIEKDKRNLR